jgi:hypothetical protein
MSATPPNEQTFLELPVVPSVSFDVELGKRLSFIDFDYAGYAQYLQKRGLTDEATEAGHIRFGRIPLYSQTIGLYDMGTHDIFVGIKAWSSQKRVNLILAHETEHKIDNIAGNIGEQEAVYQHKMIRNAKAGVVTAIAGFGCKIFGETIKNGAVESSGLIIGGLGLVGIYLSGRSYEKTAHEKHAHALENPEQFVRLERNS